MPKWQNIPLYIATVLKQTKDFFMNIYIFFKDRKNDSRVMMVLAFVACGLAIYFSIQVITHLNALSKKIPQLQNIDSYDTRILQDNILTQNFIKNADTINDLIRENIQTQKDIVTYRDYLTSLQIPYSYLLQYVYLPSLNIWKDSFTQQIDTNIIGLEYLKKNPYNDITLLQKRSDFFKYVWDNNESNDISDINIGDIVENQGGYFSMPITVSFIANSKRAFLLLVDKLSVTSNKQNIALLDEFFYYLRQEIKKSKTKEIVDLTKTYVSLTGFSTGDWATVDKVIGYHLYQRIFNDQPNILLDKKVIDQTVKSIIVCNNQSDELCYYQFREKYRDVATFGYLIGGETSADPVSNLKKFVAQLPPIFSIKEFTFDRIKAPFLVSSKSTKYQGKITIQVYGKWISATEQQEIAKVLWEKCSLGMDVSVDNALQKVDTAITQLSNIQRIDKSQSDDLRQLKDNLQVIQSTYSSLSPYKQTIKLFEIYRMIDEAWLCK